jgi:PPP family 3-phenylpropionic acid transporter
VSLPRIRLLQALEGVALGVLLPFLVPTLADRGLDPATIGLVLGVSSLASLLAYPVWGLLADGPVGRARTIALAALLSAFGGSWFLLPGGDPLHLGLAVTLIVIGDAALPPIADAITLQTLGDDTTAYGRVRAWASIGWAASALSGGVIWSLAGPSAVQVGFVLAMLGVSTLAVLSATPRPARAPRPVDVDAPVLDLPLPRPDLEGPPPSPDVELVAPPPGLVAALRRWRRIVALPVLVGFLAGILVTSIGLNASYNFVGLRILDEGGGIVLVGIAAALPAIVETPVFTSSRLLAGRLGLRRLYVGGASLTAFLTLLIALVPEPWMVAGLRAVDGIPFALRYTGMVLIIGALLPERLRAIGQSLAWFTAAGVAPILGGLLGGFVYGTFGGSALFMGCALMMALGGLIARCFLRAPTFGPGHGAMAVEGRV